MKLNVICDSLHLSTDLNENDRGPAMGAKGLIRALQTERFDDLELRYGFSEENLDWADLVWSYNGDGPLRPFLLSDVRPEISRKLVIGPNCVPTNWFEWGKNEVEQNFSEVLDRIAAYVVHSHRVARHIDSNVGEVSDRYLYLTYPVHPDIMEQMPEPKPFEARELDCCVYLKNFEQRSTPENYMKILRTLENSGLRLALCQYGGFLREDLLKVANESKFILPLLGVETQGIALCEAICCGPYLLSTLEEAPPLTPETGTLYTELVDRPEAIESVIAFIKNHSFDSINVAAANRRRFAAEHCARHFVDNAKRCLLSCL